jgi:hypothetical protein
MKPLKRCVWCGLSNRWWSRLRTGRRIVAIRIDDGSWSHMACDPPCRDACRIVWQSARAVIRTFSEKYRP